MAEPSREARSQTPRPKFGSKPKTSGANKRDFNSAIRAEAHGRVNLIGEHTDYNHGYVLPVSIPQSVIVQIRGRDDQKVIVQSDRSGMTREEYVLGTEKPSRTWMDYVQGVSWILARDVGPLQTGYEMTIRSTVPMGSGLSSSAALLVAMIQAIRDCHKLEGLDDIRISRLAQAVENEFVGARVGIMDPMAASLANQQNALFIDTESLRYEMVPIPTMQIEFVVINSGIAHRHSAGSYNQRRAECEKACELLGVPSLRQVKKIEEIEALPDVYYRRARHVFTENARVLEAVEALRSGDCEKLGELFKASHLSMSRDYEVSLPEIDQMVEIANALTDVYGARLTGGGFGGSIVVAVKAGQGARVADQIARRYREATGLNPQVLVPLKT